MSHRLPAQQRPTQIARLGLAETGILRATPTDLERFYVDDLTDAPHPVCSSKLTDEQAGTLLNPSTGIIETSITLFVHSQSAAKHPR